MDLQEYFETNFTLKPSSNSWYKFIDPLDFDNPNSKYQAVVSFNSRWVKNFNNGYSKSIFKFIADYEDISLKEVFKLLGIDTEDFDSKEVVKIKSIKQAKIKKIMLPSGYIPIKEGKGLLANRAKTYLISRGFSINKLSKLGIGYVKNSNSEYFGYIIFPFYEDKKIVYYATRNYLGAEPKHKNPKQEHIKLGKSEVLYNYNALYKYQEVKVVEGIADALTVGLDCIATLGWSLSSTQLKKIITSPVKRITIVPDRGFYKKALQTSLKLISRKKVRIMNFDSIPEKLGKDVNETGILVVIKEIEKIKYLNYQKVIYKLTDYGV